MNWPTARAADISRRIHNGISSGKPRYSFLTEGVFSGAWKSGYFPAQKDLVEDLNSLAPDPFAAETLADESPPDFIIVPCAGSGEELLWELRSKVGPDPVIATWLWDNHCNPMGNLRLALASDIVFFSHNYSAHQYHLFQPVSAISAHVPACSAQWSHAQAAEYFAELANINRKHKLIINYVYYPAFSTLRQKVLADYRDGLPDADVFLMPPEDRSRYGDLSPRERFREWAAYKATVIVPLDRDLSTRVFDALLAGLVLIVPNDIPDFDLVIPREEQERLGIIRVDSIELEAMREESQRALALYDEMGFEGALARHTYALENHMLVSRVTTMLAMFWLIGTNEHQIMFEPGPFGHALYQKPSADRNSGD